MTDRGTRRRGIGQRRIAQAVLDYYGEGTAGQGRYAARFDRGSRDAAIITSVLTRPDWLDLACPLAPGHDQLRLVRPAADEAAPLDEHAASAAAARLAETLIVGTQFVDAPLYRLRAS